MCGRHRHTQQLAESPPWFLDPWGEGRCGGKGQLEATKTASTQKNSTQSNTVLMEGVQIGATIKDLKDAEMGIPVTSPLSSPTWSVRQTDGSWRMTMDY